VTAAKSNLTTRALKIIKKLRTVHPDAHCALRHQNPLQLLVATILSAQCTDSRVNQVTPALFAKYKTAADFAAAPPGELEKLIHPTGFYRNKARSIRGCCRTIAERFGGTVPDRMEDLLQLNGIGRKTANVILGVAFGKAEGIVVDTHVARLTRRMGLSRAKTPEKIERTLMKILPRQHWVEYSDLLIWHGRRRCTARNPDCPHCEVADLCPKIGVKTKPPMNANTPK
jgi:endonuclease-3